MIFWNEYTPHTILENKKLTQISKEENIPLTTDKNTPQEVCDWFNYARIISKRHNYNIIYEDCLIYYTTLYFTDTGISSTAEETYFHKRLDKKIWSLYHDTLVTCGEKEIYDETEQKKMFWKKLINFFDNEIMEYEKKVFRHNLRVTPEVRRWFTSQDGTVRDTILNLLNNKIEKPHLDANQSGKENIVFLLCYSEEEKWQKLSPLDEKDRLRVLLY